MTKIITPNDDNAEDKAVFHSIELDRKPGDYIRGTILLHGMCEDPEVLKWHKKYQYYNERAYYATLPNIRPPVSGHPAACDFDFKHQGGDPAAATLAALKTMGLINDTAKWTVSDKKEEVERGEFDIRKSMKPSDASKSSTASITPDIRPLPHYLENAPLVLHTKDFKRDDIFIAAALDSAKGQTIEGDIYLTSNDKLERLRGDKRKIPDNLKISRPTMTRDEDYCYHFVFSAPEGGTVNKDELLTALRGIDFVPVQTAWKETTPAQAADQQAPDSQQSGPVHKLISNQVGGNFERIEVSEDDITSRDVQGRLLVRHIDADLHELQAGPTNTPFGSVQLATGEKEGDFFAIEFIARPDRPGKKLPDSASALDLVRNIFTKLGIAPASAAWEKPQLALVPQSQTPQNVTADLFPGADLESADPAGTAPAGAPSAVQRLVRAPASAVTEEHMHLGAGPLRMVECTTSSEPAQPFTGKLVYTVEPDFPAERIVSELRSASGSGSIVIGEHEVHNVRERLPDDREAEVPRLTVSLTGQTSEKPMMDEVLQLLARCPGHCEAGRFATMPQRRGGMSLSL